MKYKGNLQARMDKRAQRYAATGRPRAHKRSGWRSQVGWFS